MKIDEIDENSQPGIGYEVSDTDRTALSEWISEAKRNADLVVMDVHFHQGKAGKRNTETPPEFLPKIAHECIDTGANVFMGTGPGFPEGIEIYEWKPIFYSLGSFIV